jgi:hypothetical protein
MSLVMSLSMVGSEVEFGLPALPVTMVYENCLSSAGSYQSRAIWFGRVFCLAKSCRVVSGPESGSTN